MGRSKRWMAAGAVLFSGAVLALGTAPWSVFGADHLDAPGLTSPSQRADADINDVYVFNGTLFARTAIAMTTHPAAGSIAPLDYATDVLYKINVDQDGDAIEDLAYVFRFQPRSGGSQSYTVTRYRGFAAQNPRVGTIVGRGRTNQTITVSGSGKAFAGLRSDPFFFDLDAFRDDVLGQNRSRNFCDQPGGTGVDFFVPLNTNAIVLELPDTALGGKIGVWGTTLRSSDLKLIDRMGRPAINTVFNGADDKNHFNAGQPRDDRARFGANVTATLAHFSALDREGRYTAEQLQTLTNVLLPDVVTYDTATETAGPLNGRAMANDVIDAELNIVTGGFPFPGRDAKGAVPSDCVGQHADYQQVFPYLGNPH